MNFLIAGLGNIGEEYFETRHNIGFKVLDKLAEEEKLKFSLERHGFISEYSFKGKKLFLLKPTTYMNLSGKAIAYWLQFLKVDKKNLLVIVDDLALPFGTLRLNLKGGDAGHNGLTSIHEHLGDTNYSRLRFGIGNDYPKGKQVDYVLGNFKKEEYAQLPLLIDKTIQIVKSFAAIGPELTMTNFNGK